MSKVCPNCGAAAPDDVNFCTSCGAQLPNAAPAAGNVPPGGYAQPQGYAPPRQPVYGQQAQPPAPGYPAGPQPVFFQGYHMGSGGRMGWFKFIIYFQLFASAVVNLMSGLSYFSGMQYGGSADLVYGTIPGLSVLDKAMGAVCLAMAVFAILVRMRLAKFRRNGPLVYYCYAGGIIGLNLFYLIIGSVLVSELGITLFDANAVISILPSVIILVCNIVYFGKRKALFVN